MIIGITGSFGSGKTSVAKMFRELGAYVIDADKLCHSLMAPTKEVYKRIVQHFGNNILGRHRTINRKKLAGIVFKDKSKLKLLNRLVHPEVIREINKIVRLNKKRKLIIIDAALLVESGFYKKMDKLIVVKTNRDKQIERMIRAKGMTRKEILQRIGMQAPLKKKLALADFIIDNSRSKKITLLQVKKIWKFALIIPPSARGGDDVLMEGVGYGTK